MNFGGKWDDHWWSQGPGGKSWEESPVRQLAATGRLRGDIWQRGRGRSSVHGYGRMGAEGIQAIRVDPVSCSTCKYTWLPSRLTRLTHLRGQWAAKGLWSLTSLQSELGASRLTSGGEVVHKPRPEVAEAAKMSPAQAGWRSPLAQTKHSPDLKSLKFEKKKKVFHAKHTDMMSWLAMPHSHHKGKREKRKKINFCYSTPESSSLLSKTQSPCAPKKKKKERKAVFVESEEEPRETWIRIITEN